ncbi:MAG TPA: flippase [Vicinamibacterales bacterium]|jgi:O-antigen/teichoic acid export membrane protein
MTVRVAPLPVTMNAAALFAGRALVAMLSFLFLISAARFLGVSGFGRFMLVRMYFDLLLTLSVTGLGILITREIAKAPALGPTYLGTAAPLVIPLATLMGGALALAAPLAGYGADVRSMLWLVCLALVPASFAVLCEAVFVAVGKAPVVMMGTFTEVALYAGIGVFLLSRGHSGQSLFTALILTRTALASVYIIVLWRLFGQIPRPGSYAFTKRLCRDWRTFACENWLANITSSVSTIVLSVFHGEATVGLYAAASRITNVGTPLAASFTSAMFPHLSRLHAESNASFRRVGEDSVKYMLAIALPAVVIIATFADWIITTLYGHAYSAAVPVLRIVIWVFVLNFVNPFVSHLLFARGEQIRSLRVGAVTAVVATGLSLALIPRLGAVGAASALLGSAALACCLFCVNAFRPNPARVLMTFGKAALAAAALAGFLALTRHASPAALVAGGVGIYLGALALLRVSSPREVAVFLRGLP